MNRTAFVVCSLGLALVACRGSSTSGDDVAGDDAPPSSVQHIQDVQSDAMAPATAVSLKGVIVTAIDAYGAKTGDFWVEEPGGGEFSGVHVFGAPVDQVAAIAVGDIVDIAGAEKDEFALASDLTGRTLTELKPVNGGVMSVTKTGTGTVPAPHVVDALAIGRLDGAAAHPNAQDLEWEKWEGVLITVNNVAQLSTVKPIGSGPTADPTFKKFGITGNAQVETSLAAFPMSIDSGTCYMSITGVGDYFFDNLIFPRSTAEVVTGGAACPAAESTHTLCSDGIDNDGNGFSDCADNHCVVGDSACRATTTISAIQAATPDGPIELTDVFVTGISHDKKSIWVSSSLTAAPNEGVYVYRANNGAAVDSSVVVGAKVTVIGKVSEFNDDMMGGTLTEVEGLQVTASAGAPGTVVPVVNQTVTQLMVAATAPTYESVLVKLTDVKITALGSVANGYIATAVQAGTSFGAGTDILYLTELGCYQTVTGFWTNLEAPGSGATTKPNAFGFIPVTLGPVGTNCTP